MAPTEIWHINNDGLKVGSKLWTSRGWFEVVRLVKEGVVVTPDVAAG